MSFAAFLRLLRRQADVATSTGRAKRQKLSASRQRFGRPTVEALETRTLLSGPGGTPLAPPVKLADLAEDAMVDVTTVSNGSVDLLARIQGPKTFYAGELVNTNGAFTADIVLDDHGVMTTLASASVGTGKGDLHFEVVSTSLKLFLNSKLVAFTDDLNITAAGDAGATNSSGTTLNNFTATPVTLLTPALPFTDNFSTTSFSSQLDRNWVDRTGNITIIGGKAVGESDSNLSTINGLDASDVSATVTVSLGASQWAAVVARYSGPLESNFYLGQLLGNGNGTFTPTIWKNVDGVWTKLATGANVLTGAGDLEFETVGPSLKLIFNKKLLAFADDTDLTGGSVGMRIGHGTAVSQFQVADATPTTPALPFLDNFSTTSDGSQLDHNWIDQTGNITVVGGKATGTASFNLSTVNGLNVPDVATTLGIALSGSQWASLVTRYSGPLEDNFYLGQIVGNGNGTFTPSIWKKVNGVWTTLSTGANVNSANGTLEFESVGPSLKLLLNSNLVAYADDTDLTTGTVGMRISKDAAITSFGASAVTLLTPTLPFTDNFSMTSDGSQLDRNWIDQTGNVTVVAGKATGKGSFNLSTLNGVKIADVSATVDITLTGSQWASLVTRYSGPLEDNFYLGQLVGNGNGTFTPSIWKKVNGVWTKLNTGANVNAANGTLEFESVGPSLKLILAGKLLAWADDTSLTTGSVGMRLSQNAAVANFTATAITQLTPTLPFSDNFSMTSDGSQLDRNWTDQTGNITVVGGKATGEDSFNLSTVNGINQGDVSTSLGINLTGSQWASLVTRYAGPLEGNFYVGQLVGNGNGTFTPSIWKKVNGVWTKLNTGANVNNASGTLEFEAQGPSLKLILNSTILTWADDTDLTTGSVGMRISQSASVTNFQASAISAPTPTLPFTDTFTMTSDASQLDRNWTDQTGNITVVGGKATGEDAYNLSTLNGVSVANVTVTADVALTGSQFGSVVARYSGPLENNFYLGQVLGNGNGTFTASIWKKVSGVWTELASSKAFSGGTGTIKFVLNSDSLQLTFNSTVISALDTDLLSGSVGMRIGKGTAVTKFTAS